MTLSVYLAGQIHDDWRKQLKTKAIEKNLQIEFTGPQEEHDLSDDIGAKVLGEQPNKVVHDDAASGINNFRTELMLKNLMRSLHFSVTPISNGTQRWTQALPLV